MNFTLVSTIFNEAGRLAQTIMPAGNISTDVGGIRFMEHNNAYRNQQMLWFIAFHNLQ